MTHLRRIGPLVVVALLLVTAGCAESIDGTGLTLDDDTETQVDSSDDTESTADDAEGSDNVEDGDTEDDDAEDGNTTDKPDDGDTGGDTSGSDDGDRDNETSTDLDTSSDETSTDGTDETTGVTEPNESTNPLTATDIQEGIDDVDRFEYETRVQVDGGLLLQIDSIVTGAVDVPDRRARSTAAGTMLFETFEFEHTLIEDTSYEHVDGEWQQRDISEATVWTQLEGVLAATQPVTDDEFEVVGETTIDGTEVTVVAIETPPEIEGETIPLPDGTLEEAGFEELEELPLEDLVLKDLSITLVVADETHHPLEVQTDLVFDESGQEIDVTMGTRFTAHNDPLEIELPDEAADATEVNETQALHR